MAIVKMEWKEEKSNGECRWFRKVRAHKSTISSLNPSSLKKKTEMELEEEEEEEKPKSECPWLRKVRARKSKVSSLPPCSLKKQRFSHNESWSLSPASTRQSRNSPLSSSAPPPLFPLRIVNLSSPSSSPSSSNSVTSPEYYIPLGSADSPPSSPEYNSSTPESSHSVCSPEYTTPSTPPPRSCIPLSPVNSPPSSSPEYTPATPQSYPSAYSPEYTPSTPPEINYSTEYTQSTPPPRLCYSPEYTPSTPPGINYSPEYTPGASDYATSYFSWTAEDTYTPATLLA